MKKFEKKIDLQKYCNSEKNKDSLRERLFRSDDLKLNIMLKFWIGNQEINYVRCISIHILLAK